MNNNDQDDMNKSIGQAIRKRRRELSMTQADVADALGVNRSLVSQWELGLSRVMAGDLQRISGVLKTSSVFDAAFGVSQQVATPEIAAAAQAGQGEDPQAAGMRMLLMSVFDNLDQPGRERLLRVALALRE